MIYFAGPGHGAHTVGLERDAGGGTCMTTGIILHEILHILSVAHEQNRPDRDDYVTVHWDQIKVHGHKT